jgi:hypothetical protein
VHPRLPPLHMLRGAERAQAAPLRWPCSPRQGPAAFARSESHTPPAGFAGKDPYPPVADGVLVQGAFTTAKASRASDQGSRGRCDRAFIRAMYRDASDTASGARDARACAPYFRTVQRSRRLCRRQIEQQEQAETKALGTSPMSLARWCSLVVSFSATGSEGRATEAEFPGNG